MSVWLSFRTSCRRAPRLIGSPDLRPKACRAPPRSPAPKLWEHAQVSASETLIDFDHPSAGRLRQTRTAARFEGTPAEVTRGAPHLGEHTDDILAELGLSQAQIAKLRAQGVIGVMPDPDAEESTAAAE